MLEDFREFILRGNLVDLAVAVVIGTAFGALVTAFVADFITPLIAAIGGKQDFSDIAFKFNKSRFTYGHFINALLSFLIIAAVVVFFVVKPVNALMKRYRAETALEMEKRDCPECLSEVPVAATRCAFCTSQIPPAVRAPAT